MARRTFKPKTTRPRLAPDVSVDYAEAMPWQKPMVEIRIGDADPFYLYLSEARKVAIDILSACNHNPPREK